MAMLRDYTCRGCGAQFEYTSMGADDPAVCPSCGSSEVTPHVGGNLFHTIVPSYNGSQKQKAGFVHKFANRPAEKVSVSVPRKGDG